MDTMMDTPHNRRLIIKRYKNVLLLKKEYNKVLTGTKFSHTLNVILPQH